MGPGGVEHHLFPGNDRLEGGKQAVHRLRLELVDLVQEPVRHLAVLRPLLSGELKIPDAVLLVRQLHAVPLPFFKGIGGNLLRQVFRVEHPADLPVLILLQMVHSEAPVGAVAQDPPVQKIELGEQIRLIFGDGRPVEDHFVGAALRQSGDVLRPVGLGIFRQKALVDDEKTAFRLCQI